MNAKLTKEQWMQIGTEAGWTKTAQTQPSGNPTKVSQFLSRMDRVEKSELIKQPQETCRAFRSLIDTIEDKPYEGPPAILY